VNKEKEKERNAPHSRVLLSTHLEQKQKQQNKSHCYWYNESSNGPSSYQLQAYWNTLGAEWETGMILTWICAVFSWYFFL